MIKKFILSLVDRSITKRLKKKYGMLFYASDRKEEPIECPYCGVYVPIIRSWDCPYILNCISCNKEFWESFERKDFTLSNNYNGGF